ncbi:kinase-like domain-containing protein [Pelagophyceae sp. CCMP2097]|nr:kinase-like domain-containing protein [Pelagophyceae sp. CCMP2097]|mmetsp:Transcript_4191/g.13090  ORF Transcript_4191/g.13090 Transcript_4191/m.13090 type:complete len:314 (+) Transcript_4191:43-984(+)
MDLVGLMQRCSVETACTADEKLVFDRAAYSPAPSAPKGGAITDENADPPSRKGKAQLKLLKKGRRLSGSVSVSCLASRRVALKVASSPLEAAREVAALQKLYSPFVVRALAIERVDGGAYLALEYCAHGALLDVLESTPSSGSKRRFDMAEAAHAGACIFAALSALSAAAIAHRNLEPGNLLVASFAQGGAPTLVLADFAQAVFVTGPCTGASDKSGSPAYGAPEQRVGEHGSAVDVYSAAAVIYRCVFGREPAHDGDALEMLRQAGDDDDGPRAENFRDLLAQALQADPKDRLRVADARQHPFLAAALRRLD